MQHHGPDPILSELDAWRTSGGKITYDDKEKRWVKAPNKDAPLTDIETDDGDQVDEELEAMERYGFDTGPG